MKTFISLYFALATSLFGAAQTQVGLNGHYGSTWIFNQNIVNIDEYWDVEYMSSFAGSYGLQVIQSFGGPSGIGLDFGVSKQDQRIDASYSPKSVLHNRTVMSYTRVGLFYSYINDNNFYFEVGPQFAFRQVDIEQTTTRNDFLKSTTVQDPPLNRLAISGVLGFGGFVYISEEIKIGLGLKFGYQFNDLTTELTDAEFEALYRSKSIPTKTSTIYQFASFNELAQGYVRDEETQEFSTNYRPTHNAFASLQFGLYYTLNK